MTNERRALCFVYLVLALVALIACWRENWAYVHLGPLAGFLAFGRDTAVTPASRSITIDIVLFGLAAGIWMVREARRLRIRWVWAYLVFSVLIAISVAFPLFLIAREKALADSEG